MSIEEQDIRPGLDIAIIGMAGRFPGAKNINEFWENLKNGVETITFFSDQETIEAGCDPGVLKNPDYVRAKGIIGDIEYFDPFFFEYTPKEATILDPQIRVLHQCVWSALEDAGYVPDTYEGAIGLYAGASNNPAWQYLILSNTSDTFTAMQYMDKDKISTRISHRLNLTGPSITIETQCSTSLVAFHLACQGIISGECDMAAAGGVSISFPPGGDAIFGGWPQQDFCRKGYRNDFWGRCRGCGYKTNRRCNKSWRSHLCRGKRNCHK